jgi:hypothetical protein
MDISVLDFCLVNFVSYILGLGTGLVICLKNKDKLLVKSRSLDNLSLQQMGHYNHHQSNMSQPNMAQNTGSYVGPIMATAPPPDKVPDKVPVKITVE